MPEERQDPERESEALEAEVQSGEGDLDDLAPSGSAAGEVKGGGARDTGGII